MHYLGGKCRIAGQVADVLKAYRADGQVYLEPFVGAAWVLVEMDGKREASDVNPYLIAIYREMLNGWIPPIDIPEGMYQWAKVGVGCPDYLRGFIGIACSWGGKWFGGYARDPKSDRNYAANAKSSLLKKLPRLQGVIFSSSSFTALLPKDKLVYCDPPYEDTTGYDFCGKFDSAVFWATMRRWSVDNTVIISGYQCPDDFHVIYEMATRTDLKNTSGKMIPRVERLFKYKGAR